MVHFLEKSEYGRTRALNDLCFPDEEWSAEYYDGGRILKSRVAVKELDGKIVSMAHLVPLQAWYRDDAGKAYPAAVDYIMSVATDPVFRHRGYMDEVMRFASETMRREGKPFTFLIAVDKAIYRHLGFTYDWTFRPEEAELLAADDGLTECSAKLLCADCFDVPERLTE